METFFGFIMYILLGKRWLLWQMKQGYRGAVFVNETEIAMAKAKMDTLLKDIDKMEEEMEDIKAHPHLWEEYITSDQLEGYSAKNGNVLEQWEKKNKDLVYKYKKKAEEQNNTLINGLENRIKSTQSDLTKYDGDLQKSFAIAYSNRIKWDFLKKYKISKTYADKGYAQSLSKE